MTEHMHGSVSRIWGSRIWRSRNGGFRISDTGFWIWMNTCLPRSLDSGCQESGGLECGGLDSRVRDFGAG